MLQILYGTNEKKINVTEICLDNLLENNIITIPSGDLNRAYYFSDPLCGIVKKIYVIINEIENEYNESCVVNIDISHLNIEKNIRKINILKKIKKIHAGLKIKYGNLNDELPEQKMSVKYLTGNEKVLEIGGNIGRNSLVIASIIDNSNFVSLESDTHIANQLKENRDLNNYTFYIENSALSKRKLIQKGWDTMPSNVLTPGYNWVNTINWDELNIKYNIIFDTLVLDCEGAFYYILMDMPEILKNIKLIIMENDYRDISHKDYVDSILKQYNFYVDYTESGGWGCCFNNFFEVWKKI
jgi:FkbM family methyltransferase